MKAVTYVHLETTDGQTISLDLVDVQQERLDEKKIQIKGSSYDIFAVPVSGEEEVFRKV